MKRFFLAAAGCGLALAAQAGCYSVYSGGRLIHQSIEAPVDTTYQYHLTVPRRFGAGATMVYESGEGICPLVQASNLENSRAQGAAGLGRSRKADRG